MISQTNFFYLYDSAVLNWLKSLNLSVYSSVEDTVETTWGHLDPVFSETSADTYKDDLTPSYPRISITSSDPVQDYSRRFSGTIYNYDSIEVEDEYKVQKLEHPFPYKIPYQIDILTRSSGHSKQLLESIILQFDTNIKYITINLPDPYKPIYIKLTLDGIVDNSDLELDAMGSYQYIRKTLTVTAYVFFYTNKYVNLIDRVRQVNIGYLIDSDSINEEDEIN